MGWDVWVLDDAPAANFSETGAVANPVPEPEGPIAWVTPAQLAAWLNEESKERPGHTAVLDLTTSANYVQRHIPGAWFVIRSQLAQAVASIPKAQRYVLTCGSSLLARYAAQDLARLNTADPAAVGEHNARAAEQNRRVDAHNLRVNDANEAARQLNRQQADMQATCGARSYYPSDRDAILYERARIR